jgi:hypothetical protein
MYTPHSFLLAENNKIGNNSVYTLRNNSLKKNVKIKVNSKIF